MAKVDISSVAEEADRYLANQYSPRLISACLKHEYGTYVPMLALSWTVKRKFYCPEFSRRVKDAANILTNGLNKQYKEMSSRPALVNSLFENLLRITEFPSRKLYTNSYRQSVRDGQAKKWEKSFRINLKFRDDFLSCCNRREVSLDEFTRCLILKYGKQRIFYVLSRTVQEYWYRNFNRNVLKNCKRVSFPDMWDNNIDRTEAYIFDRYFYEINCILNIDN